MKYPIIPTKTSPQGSLWCTACNGTGQVAHYPNGIGKYIKCPVCGGSKQCTYKGKLNVFNNSK